MGAAMVTSRSVAHLLTDLAGSGFLASVRLVLEPIARDHAGVLANLFELYAHDFSEQVSLELRPNGRFDVPIDESWWQRDDHFPFFIRADDQLCGFALVRRGSRVSERPDVMDVAEFFVVRGVRVKGIGRGAAQALFAKFPGAWEIRVRQSNTAAGKFWRKVGEDHADGAVTVTPYTAQDTAWEVLRLDTSPRRLEPERR